MTEFEVSPGYTERSPDKKKKKPACMSGCVDTVTVPNNSHTWLEATLLESMNSMAERPCGQLAAGHSLVSKHRRGLSIAR